MKKILSYSFLLLSCLFMLSSCQDEEELLFDNSPEERIAAKEAEYKDVLLTNSGNWFCYYKGNLITMTFHADNTVEFESNYQGGAADRTITYLVGTSQTTQLTFESHSVFHEIYDNNLGECSYEFVFTDVSEEEIKMVSATDLGADKETVSFFPATGGELEKVAEMTTKMSAMSYRYSIEGLGYSADLITIGKTGYIRNNEISNYIDADNGYYIGYTMDGIYLSPGIQVGGEEVQWFTFNEEEKTFTSKKSEHEVVITNSSTLRAPVTGVYSDFTSLLTPRFFGFSAGLGDIEGSLQQILPSDPPMACDIDLIFDYGGYLFFQLNYAGVGYYGMGVFYGFAFNPIEEGSEIMLVDASQAFYVDVFSTVTIEELAANEGYQNFMAYFLDANGLYLEEILPGYFAVVSVSDPTKYAFTFDAG